MFGFACHYLASPFLIRIGQRLGERRPRHASSAEYSVESSAPCRSRNEMLPVQSSMLASWQMSRRLEDDDELGAAAFEPASDLHCFAKARMKSVGDTGFSRLLVGSMSPFRARVVPHEGCRFGGSS